MRGREGDDPDALFRNFVAELRTKVPDPLMCDIVVWIFGTDALSMDSGDNASALRAVRESFASPMFVQRFDNVVAQVAQAKSSLNIKDVRLGKVSWLNGEMVEPLADNVELINYLRERHAGKVVYIDVWDRGVPPASKRFRCGRPCCTSDSRGAMMWFL